MKQEEINMPIEGILKETIITNISQTVPVVNSSMVKAIKVSSQMTGIKELTSCYSKLLQPYSKVTIKIPQMEIPAVTKLQKSIMQKNALITSSLKKAITQSLVIQHNWEGCSKLIQSFATALQQSMPKISFPQISEEVRKRYKFIYIAKYIEFPIFLECDTKLQEMVLDICKDTDPEDYPLEEIKHCIYSYYDEDMLEYILDSWCNEPWVDNERKEALREAIKSYNIGLYYGCTSILMCQLGGIINDLYTKSDTEKKIPVEDRKEMLAVYNINSKNSEKAKLIQMLCSQSRGILQWYSSSEYFVHYTYSSSKNKALFEIQPGRNKICHGEQTNYGTKEHALKAILCIDIIIQLGMNMMQDIGLEKIS